jgi:hypothetical protein
MSGLVNHVVVYVAANPHGWILMWTGLGGILAIQKFQLFLILEMGLVQDNELWIIPKDGTTIVGPGAPDGDAYERAGTLDRRDGRVEGLPYTPAKITVDLQVWLEVRQCHHIAGGIKSKPPVNDHLERFGGGSHRGTLDVDRCSLCIGIIPKVAMEWAT